MPGDGNRSAGRTRIMKQNPYEANSITYVRSGLPSQLSLAGLTKAFALWGGSFIFIFAAMLFIQCYPKLPDQQPESFYITCGAIFIIGSLLSWALGCIADVAGRDRLIFSQATISILFIIMAVPGLMSLWHYGISGNAIRKTLMFLIPTIAYISSRTMRGTRMGSD